MVLGEEEVHCESYPACRKDKNSRDNLPDKGDGLLYDVNDCENGEYYSQDVNDASHDFFWFKFVIRSANILKIRFTVKGYA